MDIVIKEVTKKSELKEFIKFPHKLYKNNNYYVPQLIRKELQTLSKESNQAFRYCDVKLWLAYINNKIVGRIAGIINYRYIEITGKRCVRFGWFDFIEDERVFKRLIETVEQWGAQNNAEYIHGTYGLSAFDPSGILIRGFDELQTIFGTYNYPYYSKFLENHGFQKECDWLEYNIKVPPEIPEKYINTANIISKRYNLKGVELKNKKDLLQYVKGIFDLLNREYSKIYDFFEVTDEKIEELKKEYIPLLNLDYVSVVVNSENKVVGVGICMPSLAKTLQKLKGRLFPFGIFKIMSALRNNDTLDTMLIAIDSEYRGKGVNAIIFRDIGKSIIKNGITNIETNREMEGNTDIKNLWNKFEYRHHKRARCYIKKLPSK